MSLIEDTLKVTKKTHIKGIRRWLKKDEREEFCPFPENAHGIKGCLASQTWEGVGPNHPICETLFPRIKKAEHRVCPCWNYPLKHVTRRARELVKAWGERQ